jgi:hypothetical protein
MPRKSNPLSVQSTQSASVSTDSSPPSTISQKAASFRSAVKKGAKAITKPLKKTFSARTVSSTAGDLDDQPNVSNTQPLRKTFSARTVSSSAGDLSPKTPSHAGTPDPDEVIELSDGEVDLEKELGKSSNGLTMCSLTGPSRDSEADLAIPNLHILQGRCLCSIPSRPTLPLLPMCCSQMQDRSWWSPSFPGLQGQEFNCQSSSPRHQMFWGGRCQKCFQ